MIELLRYVVEQLVDDKSAIEITSDLSDKGETITIKVAEDDIGKIIGKQGRIAMAMRTLAKAVGVKNGKHYTIEIAD